MRKPIPYGRWLLLDRVAIGGMAEVYAAVRRDDPGARLFALKRILPTLAEDREFIQMFLDEARLVVQLDHPGIVQVHELGRHGEGYYIAMDYVPGRDLRALLARARRRGERVPVPLAAYLGWRVADALDHAHRKRDARGAPLHVVHRDVSPANVLLGFDGAVRVIDFGIAQAALRTRRDRSLRGKFGYMSPEIAAGLPADRRSDVFALGVVLHEVLTGERLFAGGSELAVLEKVRRAEVRPPSEVNPAVPRGLDAVVLRALARDPAERFAWASELRDALVPWTHAGAPAGDPPALARYMALAFPDDLRAELDRIERLRSRAELPPVDEVPAPDRTQVIALRLEDLPAAPPGAPEAQGAEARLVVQPRAAATLLVDGAPSLPPLAADEVRALPLAPGRHRVELRTIDGRRASATVELRPGATASLLGIELG